eukprot:7310039-Pyramimonas_sp.AAC.2
MPFFDALKRSLGLRADEAEQVEGMTGEVVFTDKELKERVVDMALDLDSNVTNDERVRYRPAPSGPNITPLNVPLNPPKIIPTPPEIILILTP